MIFHKYVWCYRKEDYIKNQSRSQWLQKSSFLKGASEHKIMSIKQLFPCQDNEGNISASMSTNVFFQKCGLNRLKPLISKTTDIIIILECFWQPKATRIQFLNFHMNKYNYFNFFRELKKRRMRSVEDWDMSETKIYMKRK
jgi:hypothetical protein